MRRETETIHGSSVHAVDVPSLVVDRLGLMFEWYEGMISRRTGRLVYTYEPESDFAIEDGSAIRDIASVWDVELLSDFLERSSLRPLIERSLEHYVGFLVPHHGALVLDSNHLAEPSGIAHSAFMTLALLDSHVPGRRGEIGSLADGIVQQQRADGSYRIYFEAIADEGAEFYPGEAMLALMRAHEQTRDARYLMSVERGFRFHHDRMPVASIEDGLLVFYSNWQSQYATLLHEHTHDEILRSQVRDYVFSLHDEVVKTGFYERVELHPTRQATVEVACALEGMNDAYVIASREGDGRRVREYERCIRVALRFLLRAQRLAGCTPRERGGFGHTLFDRTQRIDVTGHVAGGFIKSARNHIDA